MKKKLLTLFVFSLWIAVQAQTVATAPVTSLAEPSDIDQTATESVPWPQRLRAKVDSLLMTPLMETSQLGLMIYDMTADSTLYTYGHRQTLRPASTMKLLTAITALELLGDDYEMTTSIYCHGTVSNGTLYGNIRCVGGMDPMLDEEDLRYFVNRLRHLGIDTIRGRVLPDLSFKEDLQYGEGWCWDDDNHVLSPLLLGGKDDFVWHLERELQRDGVVIIDSFIAQSRIKSSKLVCKRSHTVGDMLTRMMKESDNLYAESLFYQLAAKEAGQPAKAKQACNQVKRMIQKVGLRPSDYRIADGSGLSLYNYVSAELETRLLRYVWRRPKMFERLYDSLPIAGVDGTLKSRMLQGDASGNVHAKTGTLTGISSLAGYCTAANGHELCFSIINQGIMRMSDGRNLQDKLCEAMCSK